MITKRNDATSRQRRLSASRGTGLLCAAVAAGALLTGCADDNDNDGAAKTGTAEAAPVPTATATTSAGGLTEDQSERKALVPKAKVGHEDALGTAVAAVPKSKPVSIELKGPADKPTWETEVATADGAAHTVRVDAVSGKADGARAKKDQDTDDKRELADRLGKATVTAQQAAETATGKTKGTVTSIELEDADSNGGAPKWSVDVVTTDDWNKTTFDIDATNRKILREHVDKD
ncbi:PepSY domain-containing protein [Streptomyces sp. G44]|uniref:PepSY domain-containing protein n=1 Tax=Streptomyces sp. G44 TaxID=2807632 RepID=UPI001960FA09|nr:PepSY domain-containing protein [Streptomyces sp. G44]MBM7168769.1 PepSY domain-containing protein [Streptomyces sp. G44]